MQSEFKYYAATLKSKKEQYCLPVEDAVLEQVRNGEKPFVYVENTDRLGYESMQMLEIYPCTDVYRTDNRSHSGIHRI